MEIYSKECFLVNFVFDTWFDSWAKSPPEEISINLAIFYTLYKNPCQ